jgi:hypothetical protein
MFAIFPLPSIRTRNTELVLVLEAIDLQHAIDSVRNTQNSGHMSEEQISQGAQTAFDFKPLTTLELPGIGELSPKGLIVIVGPNSSGKSQLLQDVYLRISGEPRVLVVATDIKVEKPSEYSSFAKWLENEGYFETIEDDAGAEQWMPKTTYGGMGGAVNTINQSQAEQWHNSFDPKVDRNVRRRSEFLNYFGRLFVTALFLDRRLIAMTSVGLIDFQTQPPQHELHALYLNDKARALLYTELVETFGKAVWPDTSRGNLLSLRVSDQGTIPTAEERLSPKRMSEFRTIESEGDGLKSYVAICVALLLGRRPVCLIDEPEMCLHPPQAHNLGRFIGRYASTSTNVTLVSTHSSQILRGIIQTAPDVQIVRLTRRGGSFDAHLVPSNVLAEAVAKPTVRAESVLDGIFAQGVVVVEADSDRLVYGTAWESMAEEFHQDIHFATVGGTGGIADTCKLYRTLKIPVAVIADLDILTDLEKMKSILEVMGDGATAKDLLENVRKIADAIRLQPPTISPAELMSELAQITVNHDIWVNEADVEVRRKLRTLSERVDRMRRLKNGGVARFVPPLSTEIENLIANLKDIGVFLVPVGELEDWLQKYELAASKRNKWAWANEAALKIQQVGRQQGNIWQFVRGVGDFLKAPTQ